MRTIQRISKRSKTSSTSDVSSRASNSGHKRIEVDLDSIRDIVFCDRTTVQSFTSSAKISKTKSMKLLKGGFIRRQSNSIKPFLKEENKRSRLQFCISMLEENSLYHEPIFKGMYYIIHIDEKWFNMTKTCEKYYLLPDEEGPICACKSKNFIGKVMFLVVIAHPRCDALGNKIFPFVTQETTKRSSVNRTAGTLETKPITSVNRNIMRNYMIEKVLPAIREKWPKEDRMQTIITQQDNAKTHINCNDIEFCEAAKQGGFDIRIMCQPSNSPDLNVLDLVFFRAIQSLQEKESAKTTYELLQAVLRSFENFSMVQSNRIFLSLQQCMLEIMKAKGCNKYKLKHMGKAKLEREGKLPIALDCDTALVQEVLQFLN